MGNKASVKSKGKIGVKTPTPINVENPKICRPADEPYHKPNEGGLSIQDIPDEVLDHVFSFLTIKERIRTAWVCRSWAEFGKNYKWSWPTKLSDEIVVHRFQKITDDILLSVLSRCGANLRKLEMTINFRESYTSTKVFDIIGSNCPNLTEILLDLWEKPREDVNMEWSLITLTKGCPKLKKISVKMSHYNENDDYANVCLALKECRSLEYLELDGIKAIAEECLDAIEVPLKGFNLWTHSSSFAVVGRKLLNRDDPIEELGFNWLEEMSHDWLLKVIRRYDKMLKVFSLQYCKTSSSELSVVPTMLKNLEVLSLKSSWLVDDEVMKVLAANCKNLWALNISKTKVTDVGICALEELPDLTCLDVSRTSRITGEGVRKFASHGRLEMFYFAGIYDVEEDILIEESSLIELAKCSPNLRLLDFRFNYAVGERLVDNLRSAVQSALIKGPVVLYVSNYEVDTKVKGCDKFELAFDPRRIVRDCGRGAPWRFAGMFKRVVPTVAPIAGRIMPWGRELFCNWGV